jgi:hypothetical protein
MVLLRVALPVLVLVPLLLTTLALHDLGGLQDPEPATDANLYSKSNKRPCRETSAD